MSRSTWRILKFLTISRWICSSHTLISTRSTCDANTAFGICSRKTGVHPTVVLVRCSFCEWPLGGSRRHTWIGKQGFESCRPVAFSATTEFRIVSYQWCYICWMQWGLAYLKVWQDCITPAKCSNMFSKCHSFLLAHIAKLCFHLVPVFWPGDEVSRFLRNVDKCLLD